MTVAPRRSSSGANRSGGVPSSVLPSSSVVICATIGRSDTLRTASIAAPISFRSRNVSRMNRSTPPSSERLRLLAEILARLVDAGLAPRLDADAERPDRAGHVAPARARRAARSSRPAALIGVQPIGQAERAELDAVGAERVGLDDVGAGADVFLVHLGDQIRLREVQRVEALVDEDALRIEHRPHRAVADEDALVKSFDERLQHLVIWLSGHLVSNRIELTNPMTRLPNYQITRSHVSSRSRLERLRRRSSRYDLVTTSRPIERTPWRTESVNS